MPGLGSATAGLANNIKPERIAAETSGKPEGVRWVRSHMPKPLSGIDKQLFGAE
jgi:hypothetical protein